MRFKRPGEVLVTPRDREILKHLFENKIATQKQIAQKFFPGKSKQAVSQRILKLKKESLIDLKGVIVDGLVKKCLVIKSRSVSLIEDTVPYTIDRDPIKSDSPEHDLILSDLIEGLKNYKTVSDVMTEASLRTYKEIREDINLGVYGELRSDGVVAMDIDGNTAYAALEYERNIKSNARYFKKLRSYYDQETIGGVLFICENERMRKLVYTIDSKIRSNQSSKFFLALKNDVQSLPTRITFKNFKGQIFEL